MEIIRILNMEEFNPRKDRKKHSWFRVDNTIVFSKKLHGLSPAQKWLWISIVALASADQRDFLEYDIKYFRDFIGGTEDEIRAAICHFQQKKMIEVLPAENAELESNISELELPETAGDQSTPVGVRPVTNWLPVGDQSGTSGVPTDGQTDRQTLRTDGQTPPLPIQNLRFEKFKTLLADPLNAQACEVLRNIPEDLLQFWLLEFPDPDWVIAAIRKAITKRKGKGLTQKPEEWPSILTSWLYGEKNPPFKPKPVKEYFEPEVDRNPKPLASLVDPEALKRFGLSGTEGGDSYAN